MSDGGLPPAPGGGKRPPLPSNAKPQSEYAMQELKKTAASRGITVEKLIAQLVQQYLKEDKDTEWDGKV